MLCWMLGGVLEAAARPTEADVSEVSDVVSEVPDGSRRRFTCSAVVGVVVASVPFLWILTNEWTGKYNLLRANAGPNFFYDEQAQSMIHGHLWVPTGSLGIEGFIHDGRTYTYFGLLLSLFRIPIILVAPHSVGHMTAPSILVAWLLTGLFSSLLIWRVRILLRGAVALGWAEAVSFGVLVATIMGGSILLFLASAPRVSDEDIAWTIPITIATLFVFLGILDRPSTGRVVAAGTLVLAGALERSPPALACMLGALLIAGWFLLGRGGVEHKRWALPMVVVGLVPAAVWGIVNWLKFGSFLNGVPLADQVWTHVNAHRHDFLVATGGKGFSLHFLPTTLWAYLQPFGLRVQSTFPFLSLPIQPPHVFGGYVVDTLYPTASVPGAMPLLFLLSCWALVVAFRPGAGRGATLMRIPLIAAAGATAVDFVWGYIAPRYVGDFLPFLVLGAAVGMVDLWRRWERRRRAARRALVAVVIALGLFGMAANIGLAFTPTNGWTPEQATNYLQMAKAISDATGHPLSRQVEQGSVLPYWAPANQVFVAGDCAGLYLSSGKRVSTFPVSQLEHRTWLPVEQGSGIRNTLKVTFNTPPSRLRVGVPLLTIGQDSILIQPIADGRVQFILGDRLHTAVGMRFKPMLGMPYQLHVMTDPYLQRVVVHIGTTTVLSGVLSGVRPGAIPLVVHTPSPVDSGLPAPVTVVHEVTPQPNMSLCRSLLNDR
jgi:hypothetical protein